jgi:hypothetical protein
MRDLPLSQFSWDGRNKSNRRFFDLAKVRRAQDDRVGGGEPSMLPQTNERDPLTLQG